MKKDIINITVLDGGILKMTTPGGISAPNHMEAEKLVRDIEKAVGGKTTIKHLGKSGHAHTHADGTSHTH